VASGHAAPVFYAVLVHAGYFDHEELCGLRRVNCRAEGHPVEGKLPGIKTTSGSLGKGISVGLVRTLNALPVGLAPSAEVARPVEKGEIVSWDDVKLDEGSTVVKLRRQQDALD